MLVKVHRTSIHVKAAAEQVIVRWTFEFLILEASIVSYHLSCDPHQLGRSLLIRAEDRQVHIAVAVRQEIFYGGELLYRAFLSRMRGAMHDGLEVAELFSKGLLRH